MTAAAPSDAQLARDLMGGSVDAFNRFVETYHDKLFRYSLSVCGQRQDAEEVAQETLLRVFESLDQLREPERLKAWVFRIAKNACLSGRSLNRCSRVEADNVRRVTGTRGSA